MNPFQQIENAVKHSVDEILQHPFFMRLGKGICTKNELKIFAQQYYLYCEFFPKVLALVASKVPDDQTRFPLIENLWDEHGRGDLEKSHRALFKSFVYAVGLSDQELSQNPPLPFVFDYIEKAMTACDSHPFLYGLGFLGIGLEQFTSAEYQIIYDALHQYDFSEPGLTFWKEHIGLDDLHYAGFIQAASPWLKTEQDIRLLKKGAEEAIALEKALWDGLDAYLLAETA
ncbi:iron-containing redox enzyme family protein [Patescibacteria group bacterium]|nr:MAG: iron-containing redox enzyme family protein [Patescibacteria group bacterium]